MLLPKTGAVLSQVVASLTYIFSSEFVLKATNIVRKIAKYFFIFSPLKIEFMLYVWKFKDTLKYKKTAKICLT